MKTNYDFHRSGNMIISAEVDMNIRHAATHRGSAGAYGVFELGRSYVAQVVNNKPDLCGFSQADIASDKIKIVNRNDIKLEEGKYYIFSLIKIELGPLRVLNKIKFRAVEEIDISFLD